MKLARVSVALALVVLPSAALFGCSSSPKVKQQAYAKLANERDYEYEFPVVWKAVEASFRNYKIAERDPSEVGALEMNKITKRTLVTDWILGQSRDKYIEYKINNTPRKQYLQTRVKYELKAESVIGGTHVAVKTKEEIEKLDKNGKPAGWDSVGNVDPSRAAEILEKVAQSINSAIP
jgi:hypothetical protein